MTTVRARYYPCQVRLPDGTTLRKAYVLLANSGPEAGLWCFTKPDEARPAYRAAVDWGKTVVRSQRDARNGADVWLADGTLVVLTAGASCRCGSLGRWAGPGWASRVAVAT